MAAFALSADVTKQGVTVRAAGPGDRPFFRALFATARVDAPILAQWPAAQREPFLDSQFLFQERHYGMVHAGADYLAIERHGELAGRLILDRAAKDWCIVDIALAPALRGSGLGALLLKEVQAAAKEQGAERIVLHVEIGNRARALYERLGFVETDDVGTHIAMEWTCG